MSDSAISDPLQQSHEDAIRLLIDGDTPWDRRLIQASRWLNPILVKETRQALKSKQFSWTFMLLIIFTIAWTLIAVISSIPNVYYDSDGSSFLLGYVVILMLPSLLVIPQVAFRSMSSELEDGTFETLSLSMLSPKQVVYGKLSVAALQLTVYLSILAPCIALTYLLQGVTLESIAALLLVNGAVSMFLCSISILMASIGRSRTLQIKFSVFLVLLQLFAIVCMFPFIWTCLSFQGLDEPGWTAVAVFCLFLGGYAWIALRCAWSSIDMPSANRSTPVRVAVFVVGMAIVIVGVFLVLTKNLDQTLFNDSILIVATLSWIHWGITGGMMMGESGIVTYRARRTLPDSYFGRLFLTWFNPGAGPAYLLVILSFFGPWLGIFLLTSSWNGIFPMISVNLSFQTKTWFYISALGSYLALYLGLVRLMLLAFFRKTRASRILLAFASMLVMLTLGILVSLMGSLIASNFREMVYDWYCFINPMWTLSELGSNMSSEAFFAWVALLTSAGLVLLINALLTSRDTMISRVETPPRVLAEQPRKESSESEQVDPWKES